jgi:tol-pal system protein YbgF
MKKKVLIAFLLLALPCYCFSQDNEESMISELEIRIENLEKNSLKAVDNSALISKIETLEEAIKNLNNKVEELNRQINQYSNSLNNISERVDSKVIEDTKTSNQSQEDIIEKLANNNLKVSKKTLPDTQEEKLTPETTDRTQDSKTKFEEAFTLLKESEYEQAEKAFNNFITQHPKDELSGNAYYWLGESFYLRKIYNKAALNYLYSIKYFPSGSKAEMSSYKLSLSFAKLNKKQEACQSFHNFLDKFKKAPSSLIKSAQDEIKKLNCSKSR